MTDFAIGDIVLIEPKEFLTDTYSNFAHYAKKWTNMIAELTRIGPVSDIFRFTFFILCESIPGKSTKITLPESYLIACTKLEKGTQIRYNNIRYSMSSILCVPYRIQKVDTILNTLFVKADNNVNTNLWPISFEDFLSNYEVIIDSTYTVKIEPYPKNNDGRSTCAWCNFPTKHIPLCSSWADICTKCGR